MNIIIITIMIVYCIIGAYEFSKKADQEDQELVKDELSKGNKHENI